MASIQSLVRAFPLYDNLRDSLITRINKGWICPSREKITESINSIESDRAQQISLLIIHYYFLCNPQMNPFTSENCDRPRSGAKSVLPFGIKTSLGGKGISVDVAQLPDSLVMILAEFCEL